MKSLKMFAVLLAGLVLGGLVLSGCENKGKVIAVVGGDKIYETEFKNMLTGLYGADAETTAAEEESIYESLISNKLIEQEVKKLDLDVKDKDIEAYIKEIITANGVESKDAFYEELRTTYGYSKSFVDNLIKSSLEEKKLYDYVVKKEIKVDDALVKKTYDENPVKFKQVEVSHILISIDDTTTEAAALSKAKSLIARLATGEDFVSMAKANSDDTGSAANGGLLSGFFGADNKDYVAEFVAASVKLEAGEFTRQPVKSDFGYHIIKANNVKKTFDEVKDYVTESIYAPLREEAFTGYIEKLKKATKIERKMKFDQEEAQTGETSSQLELK